MEHTAGPGTGPNKRPVAADIIGALPQKARERALSNLRVAVRSDELAAEVRRGHYHDGRKGDPSLKQLEHMRDGAVGIIRADGLRANGLGLNDHLPRSAGPEALRGLLECLELAEGARGRGAPGQGAGADAPGVKPPETPDRPRPPGRSF